MPVQLPTIEEVERLPEQTLPVRYPRDSGWRPAAEDNPLNAWYWRCSITGAEDGLLAGKRIAIKDNVAVAGVPMMNGCSVLEGYVPEVDATVVTRILEAGGEIVGKAACEDLCFSGGSHTCRTGPIRNPWNSERSAGGSSGGSAALVANGDVDLALGGDQGGSVRIPSCWCGTVGHKPTHGLVPFTGAFPIELTLDHLGPIGRTVGEVAAFLEAIACTDSLDPRQPAQRDPLDEALALTLSAMVRGSAGGASRGPRALAQDAGRVSRRRGHRPGRGCEQTRARHRQRLLWTAERPWLAFEDVLGGHVQTGS